MSKAEATRLADALAVPPQTTTWVRADGAILDAAISKLRQWPDGKPVAWQAQVFNVRHLTVEVRLRGINGAEVPQDFVESGTIVEVRAVGTAPPDSAARIAELEKERDDFHMQYRVKCDEETKAQAVRIAELEAAHRSLVSKFHHAVKDAGWHPGRTDDDLCEIIRAKGATMKVLEDELALRRQSGGASDRLHNICQAISEEADGSAFSRKEWERIDAENTALRATLKVAGEALEALMDPAANEDSQWYKDARDKGRAALQQIKEAQHG